jgi:hypothetical protein
MAAATVSLNDGGDALTTEVEFRGARFVMQQRPSSSNHGLIVWDASHALLDYFAHKSVVLDGFKGQRVLELGAGCGLVGLALAAVAGASVTLTDLPSVIPNLRANVTSNLGSVSEGQGSWERGTGTGGGRVKILPYAWGEDIAHLLADGPFDAIVATDVAYDAGLNPLLVATAARIAVTSEALAKGGGGSGGAGRSGSSSSGTASGGATSATSAAEAGAGAGCSSSSILSASSSSSTSSAPARRSRPCVVYFANEVRCQLAQEAFDEAAKAHFGTVTRIPTKQMPAEWRGSNMLIFRLKTRKGGASGGGGGSGGAGREDDGDLVVEAAGGEENGEG